LVTFVTRQFVLVQFVANRFEANKLVADTPVDLIWPIVELPDIRFMHVILVLFKFTFDKFELVRFEQLIFVEPNPVLVKLVIVADVKIPEFDTILVVLKLVFRKLIVVTFVAVTGPRVVLPETKLLVDKLGIIALVIVQFTELTFTNTELENVALTDLKVDVLKFVIVPFKYVRPVPNNVPRVA
jgi:hypothetical protein